MEIETSQFLQERGERVRILHEKQENELDQFDEESARLGFRLVIFVIIVHAFFNKIFYFVVL